MYCKKSSVFNKLYYISHNICMPIHPMTKVTGVLDIPIINIPIEHIIQRLAYFISCLVKSSLMIFILMLHVQQLKIVAKLIIYYIPLVNFYLYYTTV